METLTNKKRACIMIVDHDLGYGIKLADWLASQRYHAVLVRSYQTAIAEVLDIRPHAVLVGLAQTGSVFPINLQRLFRAIETTYARILVITMGNRTIGVLANLLYGGAIRCLHLPIKPFEFTYVGRLLRSELSAATAVQTSPRMESGPPDCWGGENPARARHSEASTWIA